MNTFKAKFTAKQKLYKKRKRKKVCIACGERPVRKKLVRCLRCLRKNRAHSKRLYHKVGEKMDKEKIFTEFLEEYLKNVQKMLPQSYRAQQLKSGGVEEVLVFKFETDFLKEPFMNALKKINDDEEIFSGCPKCNSPMPHGNHICMTCKYDDREEKDNIYKRKDGTLIGGVSNINLSKKLNSDEELTVDEEWFNNTFGTDYEKEDLGNAIEVITKKLKEM